MKNFKKLMALVVAAMMIVATFNIGTFAAVPDDTIEITGLEEGDIVNFYQVLEWAGDSAGNTTGWKYKDPFNATNVGLSVEDLIGNPAQNIDPGITPAIAGTIARIPGTATPTFTKTVQSGETGVVQQITYSDADPSQLGLYVAVIKAKDPDTVYQPVFVSADFVDGRTNTWIVDSITDAYYGPKAATKKSEVGVKKEAHVTEENYQDAKWQSTKIGELVSFTTTAVIPAFSDVFEHPHFVMKDVMTDLTLVYDSVEVVDPFDSTKTLTDGTEYTKARFNLGTKAGYSITFDEDYLKNFTVPTTVTVTYDAIVSSDAKLNVNEEKNEVWIEYNHDTTDEGDFNVKKDDTKHYTFGIDAEIFGNGSSQIGGSTGEIVKVGLGPDGKPINDVTMKSNISPLQTWEGALEGAVFGLYTDAACNTPYIPLNDDGTSTGIALTATSDATGRITFTGLDAGTYYLKEISAPTGFIKSTTILEIEITANFGTQTDSMYYVKGSTWADGTWQEDKPTTGTEGVDYKVAEYEYDILLDYTVAVGEPGKSKVNSTHRFTNDGPETFTWVDGDWEEIPTSIPNTQGVELPSTGGMGTTLFYAIGAILVLGAGILLVSKRRMSAY